ncbi:MAG: hypothetical protein ACYCWW_18280, partial [Deltaproteobacteria bacterium]
MSEAPLPSRARLPPWGGAALFLGLAFVVFFAKALFSDGVPYYRDILVTCLPLRAYLTQRLRAGQLPQWFPYEGLGVPFIGQIVTATFHPKSLLLLPLDALSAIKVNLLIDYLVAEAGAYLLCRRAGASRIGAACGAVALAFGGYALGMASNLVFLDGYATLPWVAWAALRLADRPGPRPAALLAAAWALVLLAGDAQSFLFAPLLFVPALEGRLKSRPGKAALGWMALAGLLSVTLCAAELVPALSVAAASGRRAGAASS